MSNFLSSFYKDVVDVKTSIKSCNAWAIMTRSLYSSYYKSIVADKHLYQNLERLSYNVEEYIV